LQKTKACSFATALHSALPGRDRTWRVDAVTWPENNTEAIVSLHNKGRRAFALPSGVDFGSGLSRTDYGEAASMATSALRCGAS